MKNILYLYKQFYSTIHWFEKKKKVFLFLEGFQTVYYSERAWILTNYAHNLGSKGDSYQVYPLT